MDYKELRKKFVEEQINSTARTFKAILKKADEYQSETGKIFEEFTIDDFEDFVKEKLIDKSANSVVVKVSLCKRYVTYIGKDFVKLKRNDIIKMTDEYLRMSDNALKYLSWDELKDKIRVIENDIDKAIMCLLRMGIGGTGFEELINLKTSDIDLENRTIKLENRIVDITDDFILEILEKAIDQKVYTTIVHRNGVPKIEEYAFNRKCEYFIKPKPKVTNNEGLEPFKQGGMIGKVYRITTIFNDKTNMNITSINLQQSYATDMLIKHEDELGKRLSIRECNDYVKSLGLKQTGVDIRDISICIRNKENG